MSFKLSVNPCSLVRLKLVKGLISSIVISLLTLFTSLAWSDTNEQRNTRFFVGVPDPMAIAAHMFPDESSDSSSSRRTTRGLTSRGLVVEERNGETSVKNAASVPILFHFGKTEITEKSLPVLDSFGEMLQMERLADKSIVIEGHTDSVGSEEFNQVLSERRARAIKRYLVQQFEIDPSRLFTEGRGEMELAEPHRPKNINNRRVEFIPY